MTLLYKRRKVEKYGIEEIEKWISRNRSGNIRKRRKRMRIRIVKCIALIISAGVLIYSIIATYSVVRVVGAFLLLLIAGKLYQTIEGMHVLKIRDELNEEFR